jgi:hypothetical protein
MRRVRLTIAPVVKRWSRIAACLLLSAIGADLVGDTCDLPSSEAPLAATLTARQAPPAADEDCVSVCVPDCYCCSTVLLALPPLLPPDPGPLVALDVPAKERRLAGVNPVPERPPLLLA